MTTETKAQRTAGIVCITDSSDRNDADGIWIMSDELGSVIATIENPHLPDVQPRQYKKFYPTMEANARHWVACWNALEGIPTEALEGGVLGSIITVARKVVDWNTKYPTTRWYSQSEISVIAKEMDAIHAEARAALAKLEGRADA